MPRKDGARMTDWPHRLTGAGIESLMANTETAVLGGGCFWCVEAALLQLEGVLNVESGYMGGKVDQPTYEQVCSGNTGHAEVVKVRSGGRFLWGIAGGVLHRARPNHLEPAGER
jgi:hypothetical protein